MDISVKWSKPVELHDGQAHNLVYALDDDVAIPDKSGVYVFARAFGDSVIPLYVGQATNLERRIGQQLNNVQLMVGIKNSPNGKRILLHAVLELKRGQQEDKVLDVVEKALIKSALGMGYELLNNHGVKTQTHSIKSDGRKEYHFPFARRMNIESR